MEQGREGRGLERRGQALIESNRRNLFAGLARRMELLAAPRLFSEYMCLYPLLCTCTTPTYSAVLYTQRIACTSYSSSSTYLLLLISGVW
jgi:hypothetical protein